MPRKGHKGQTRFQVRVTTPQGAEGGYMDKLRQLIALYHQGQMTVDLMMSTVVDIARSGDSYSGKPEEDLGLVLLSLIDRKALKEESDKIVARLEEAINS